MYKFEMPDEENDTHRQESGGCDILVIRITEPARPVHVPLSGQTKTPCR